MANGLSRGGALVIVAVGLAQVCVTLDYFSLTVALPQMAADLGVTTTDTQWALSAYLLSFAALLVAGGRVGDILGRKRVLVVGVAIFGTASLLVGLSDSLDLVIVWRAVQGVGAAILFPVSMAIVANSFDEDVRPRAIGIVVAVSTIGTAVGPFVGGVLTETLDWRWVFFLNVPFAAIAIALILRVVADSRDRTASRRIDVPGIATLSAAIVGITLAIDRGPAWAEEMPVLLVALIGGSLALLGAFILIERRVAAPLIDLPTFRNGAFALLTVSGCLSNFLWALSVFVATLWLQEIKGLSPLEAGLAFLTMSLGVAVAGPLSGRLLKRFPLGAIMAASSLLGGMAAIAISFVTELAVWLPLFGVLGLGVGLNYALTNQGALSLVPIDKSGASSGIALTALVVTAALGTVIGATLLEELSGGPTVTQTAADRVMLVGAVVALVSAVPAAAIAWRERRAAGRVPSVP